MQSADFEYYNLGQNSCWQEGERERERGIEYTDLFQLEGDDEDEDEASGTKRMKRELRSAIERHKFRKAPVAICV
ncbi:uncharacterized protein G2W53_013394 [Senna tora]|uniref:Uncharacterized protein n=1 Tax=Senna tora TaxID=362788 RepID=A0A834U1S9_9FABA|nr:uncharacterized protein G2W53_013394 [Senna tora]